MTDHKLHTRTFLTLQTRGRLIQPKTLQGLAVNSRNHLTHSQPSFSRWPTSNHSGQNKAVGIIFKLDTKSNEIPVDDGIKIFQLVRCQAARKFVEGITGTENKFHVNGLSRDSGGGPGCIRNRGDNLISFFTIWGEYIGPVLTQPCTQFLNLGCGGLRRVEPLEFRVAKSHFKIVHTASAEA